MNRVAAVVIWNSTRQFDKVYHYLVPEKLLDAVKSGMRVLVPFGKSDSLREAFVVEMLENSDIGKLKEIWKPLDENPVLDGNLIELGKWMRKRYICSYCDAFKCMLPAGLGIKKEKIIQITGINRDKCTTAEERIIKAIMEAGGAMRVEDIKESLGKKESPVVKENPGTKESPGTKENPGVKESTGMNESHGMKENTGIKESPGIKDGLGGAALSRLLKSLEKKGVIRIEEKYHTRAKEKFIKAVALARPADEIAELIESNAIKSIQQIRALEILMENESVPVADLAMIAGVSGSVLKTLEKKGHIEFFEIEVVREPWLEATPERTSPLKPTDEQKAALDGIKAYIERAETAEVLLHGVTGSGKTEVYMQLISEVLSRGKQAIVLVPEISLTPQMVNRFRARFGDDVAVQHSRLSLGERYDQWRLIKERKIRVVVGARSAIFSPLENLGIIIIDEEHESSYKSAITPRYDAREVARARCRQSKALLVLGSATPSVETAFRIRSSNGSYFPMVSRPNRINLPEIIVVDMRKELEAGNRSMFSRKLEEEIGRNIEAGQQTMLLMNRRGHSNFVLCRSCGHTIRCPYCSISLTYHSNNDRLTCHYCGYSIKNPSLCPECGSKYIRFFGAGTQKVEMEIQRVFPGASVIRMDMDTTTGKNAHEMILRRFQQENINILIGTQMIAKGHDFPNVTLVGVLAADAMLNISDYMASERTFQLLTQVAGRAGRGNLPGRVVIQTYNTDDYSITNACRHDYEGFYKSELMVREKLGYPPFCHIGVIITRSAKDKLSYSKSLEIYKMLAKLVEEKCNEVIVTAPKRAPLYRIQGLFRWRIVVKCKSLPWLVNAFTRIADECGTGKDKGADVSIDINPVNML
jgi:primosomal protein N' (replication factor Y)